MGHALQVLVVEDNADDVELILRELKKAGFDAAPEQVETAAALRAALPKRHWDLCIADYSLPSFGASEALEIVRAELPKLPFIVVSGTIGEERAVALMRAGADDYFLKGNLGRLGAAVERAIGRAAELGRSESRLEAIMAGILEGVVATDEAGTITYFNAGAERIFALAAAAAVGRPISDLFPERLRDHQRRFLESSGTRGSAEATGVMVGRRANGEEFPIEATISQVSLGGDVVATHVIRDITEQLKAAGELRSSEARLSSLELQKAVLEQAAAAKSAFIASMNHELRTPLNAILGYSDLLIEQLVDVPPKHLRYLQNVKDAGGHLLALISDVLDLASLDASKMKLRPEPIALALLLEPALAATRLAADKKGVGFRFTHPDVIVHADPVRVREILHNLLSNSVKFTPPGGEISLEVATEGGTLLLTVADNGAGIPAESHGRVFGAFERFHEELFLAPGTGLGLALTRQLVELHGGTITFESDVDVRTVFHARLPDLVKPGAHVVGAPAAAGAAKIVHAARAAAP